MWEGPFRLKSFPNDPKNYDDGKNMDFIFFWTFLNWEILLCIEPDLIIYLLTLLLAIIFILYQW